LRGGDQRRQGHLAERNSDFWSFLHGQDGFGPADGTNLSVADVEKAGVDLLQRPERGVCGGLSRRRRLDRRRLGARRPERPQPDGRKGDRSAAEQPAAQTIDVFQPHNLAHR
jgi:hypothetical protein